ncbi:MAG: cyclic nucleotide-binding domain-containing protein [Verrucomicrobia bacterium]|nr:cyclic nucleotide-binding domain-containing protein [Verrucomicrobiota bacterium]
MSSSETRFVGALTEELHALGRTGQIRRFAAGEVIFRAGDAGDGFYIVDTGRVQISAVVGSGQSRVLATIGHGDYFGEMALLDDAPRSATATAETETEAHFLPRGELLGILEKRPQFALNLIREFSLRMRALNQKYADEILQAERLAVVGRFAGTIVHDFKNPLQVIGLAAELACSDFTAPPMRHLAQNRIARQVERMTNMLHELIEFTKPSGQKPHLSLVNFARYMNPLVDETRQEIGARRVQLELVTPAPEIDVRVQPQRLSRLFYNLFNNAVDELPDGGKIFLRFVLRPEGRPELRVEIEDTGRGVAPEIAQTLFEPFATHGKTHGTGLGLTICKRIVEDHGGRIWARSEPGKGATFCFTLPLDAQL